MSNYEPIYTPGGEPRPKWQLFAGVAIIIIIVASAVGFAVWRGDNKIATNPSDVSLDSDNDGLLDSDESIYGTDITKADTDGDGYSDYEEVQKGYNPLGGGLLAGDQKKRAAVIKTEIDYSQEFEPMEFSDIKDIKSSINFNRIKIGHHVFGPNINGTIIRKEGGYVAQIDEDGNFRYWTYKPKTKGVMTISVECRFDAIPAQTVSIMTGGKIFKAYIPEITHCSDGTQSRQRQFYISKTGAAFVDQEWESGKWPDGEKPGSQYKEELLVRSSVDKDNTPLRFTEDHCYRTNVSSEENKDNPIIIKLRQKTMDDCFVFIAEQNSNAAYCDKVSDAGKKMGCHNRLASGKPEETEAAYTRTIVLPDAGTLGARTAPSFDYCSLELEGSPKSDCERSYSKAMESARQCEAQNSMLSPGDCQYDIARKVAGYKDCGEYEEDGCCNCTEFSLYERKLNRDPKICAFIPAGIRQDRCLRDSAAEIQDPFLCDYISDRALYYQCFFEIAKAADLPHYCEHIDNDDLRAKCYRKIVGVDLTPKGALYCDNIKNDVIQGSCRSVQDELRNYCGGVVHRVNVQAFCYWDAAVKQQDISLCQANPEAMQIKELSVLCEYETCLKANESDRKQMGCQTLDSYKDKELTSRCGIIPKKFNGFGLIDRCYALEAKYFSDSNICNYVTGSKVMPEARDYCFGNLAVYLDNKTICERIENPKIKKTCFEYSDSKP